ncbi:MAG: InlB B-repeat-containing protein [Anaeroplasmataceae bacterium]|nr:InlB B-repeat-containing protein [Anaeroplasmataceae bacterium]
MKKFFSMLLLLCGLVTLSATLVVNAAEKEVKYTVASATSVTCDDPDVAWVATYKNTYSSGGKTGQITKDNSLTLTLSNIGEDILIKQLVMSTKTNKSTGAGTVTVTIGETTVYSNNYEKPNGATFVDYVIENTDAVKGDLSVVIACTTNSLYCESYKIVYEVEGDTTLSYDTVFNYNYEECPADVTVSTEAGKEVKFVSDPSRKGFNFVGWFDAAEGGNKIETLTSSEENHNKTLYAHWEEDTSFHAIINADNFKALVSSGSGYTPYNGNHAIDVLDNSSTNKVDSLEVNSYQVMLQSGLLQFQKSAGYLHNSIAISGHIKSITMNISEGDFFVSTSTSELTADGDNVVTLNSTNSKLVVTNPADSFFRIQVGSALGKVSSIDIAYEYVEKQTYTVSFNEGLGTFVEGKGTDIIADLGTTKTVVLPKAADMATRPYKYTVLSGWNDGTKTYQPGASVQVSGNKTFSAVYTAPSNLTIAQAIEVADITGTTATTYSFSTKATIKEINGSNVVLTDTSTADTFVAYNPSNLSSLAVGDKVTVVGKIKIFNSVRRYDAPKVTVTKPAYATEFEKVETKASLKLDGDSVSIRFGNMMSVSAYNEAVSTKYGVVVSKNAAYLQGLTTDILEASSTEYLAVECNPVRVNAQGELDENGEYYQFALVLTDVPQAEFDATLFATMYVIANGQVYTAQVKEASVKSVAAAYLEGDTSNFSENTMDILNILANA